MTAQEPKVLSVSKEDCGRTLSQYARGAKVKRAPTKEKPVPEGRVPQKQYPGQTDVEYVKPFYLSKRGTLQVVRGMQLSSPTGPEKYKWYAPQVKICRDRLKWCEPPWISTTNKRSFT